ncbi:MAG: lytic transglycosylase domain-containing protein [Micavibrio aeruginosavorus]|uniref:Lytic transglycosylase domain-containing protein n=1 Tax=Micavibrio aeruginosavorus TaxID=349221 RepID=A0A7T5R1R6_9BACT|nr:MAG: lytic transglycosylase domain-containing protein [Micavibrio aeruginosavorus]
MHTRKKTTKRLKVLSLGVVVITACLLNAAVYAAGIAPIPARKPAAFRADPLALLRFPALNQTDEPAAALMASPAIPAPVIPGHKPPVPQALTHADGRETMDATASLQTIPIPARKPEASGLNPTLQMAATQDITAESASGGDNFRLTLPETAPATLTAAPSLEGLNKIYKSKLKRAPSQRDSVARLVNIVKQDVSSGSPTRALKRLSSDKAVPYLDPVEKDQMQTLIARGYLLAGKVVQAYELAAESAARSGKYIPQAGWVAGLAAWRMGNYEDAARLFANSANSSYSSSWQASASSYWASRSYMRARKPQEVSLWLKQAAQYPRTFYGLIATRSLGWDYDFNWDTPALTAAHKKILEDHSITREALTLVKNGDYTAAENALAKIDTSKDPALAEALLAYAAQKNLPALGMKLAQAYGHPKGGYYDSALYPLLPWKLKDGYTVDRALVHAIIRQESKFNPGAVSRSGAQGLMQVMPSTASYISGKSQFKNKESHASLRHPQTNLEIGQRYIEKLLYQDHVDAELFSLVVAYNAGPGNLKKWKRELADMQSDPLLFIESIPMGETRAYVERVMSNYWIYRLRMNQPVPSLDAVAEGEWAQYVPIDGIKQAGLPSLSDLRLADAR